MTTTSEESTAPRWRLQVWSRGKELIHDSTCVGNEQLDATLSRFEKRADFGRFAVAPDVKTGRQSITRTDGQQGPPPAEATPVLCRECGLTAPDCRRREAVSGHTYTPTEGA